MNSLIVKPTSKAIMSSNQMNSSKKNKSNKLNKPDKKTTHPIDFEIEEMGTPIIDTSSIKEKVKEVFDPSKDTYIEAPWTIIGSYFENQHLDRLVRHQVESYNNFVGLQLPQTIDMFNDVHIKSENDFDKESGKYSLEIFIKFENFHIYRPQIHENNGAIKLMFPQEARLRNLLTLLP